MKEGHTQEKVQGSHYQNSFNAPTLTTNHTKTYKWCISSTSDSKKRYSMAQHRQDVR